MLWFALLLGAAPVYETRGIPAFDGRNEPALKEMARQRGVSLEVDGVVVGDGLSWSKLSDVQSEAFKTALRQEGFEGSELDVLVGHVPVTLTWSDGVVTLVEGPSWTPSLPPADAAKLGADFGVEAVEDGRAWSDEELALVHLALSKLSEAEQKAVRGLIFVRRGKMPDALKAMFGGHPVGGLYHATEADRRIEIYDPTLKDGVPRFVGPVDDPAPFRIWPIVHELGHAISDAPVYAEYARYQTDHAELMARGKRFNALVDERNLLVDRYNAERTEALADQIAALDAKMAPMEKASRTLEAELRKRFAALPKQGDEHPAVAAYVSLGAAPATMYAAASPKEGFAEAFALYHLDPAALKRVSPKTLTWFEKGKHLNR